MHDSIKRAYEVLARRAEQQAAFEEWAESHRDELADLRLERLMARAAVVHKDASALPDIIYKTTDNNALQRPEPQQQTATMDEQTAEAWNRWCDSRIGPQIEMLAEIVGSEAGITERGIRQDMAKMRADLDALRAEVEKLKAGAYASNPT